MASRRSDIAMTEAELQRFLAEEELVTCASKGPNGRPHLMPLSYVTDGRDIITWTYGKSQKVRNLERLPQATLQVEAGQQYDELRGAMLECDAEIVRDLAAVTAIGVAVAGRRGAALTPEQHQYVAQSAAKRVGLRFRPTRVVSWDHRKLKR